MGSLGRCFWAGLLLNLHPFRRLLTAVAALRFYLNCADPDAVNIQILQAASGAARTQNLPLPLLEAGREKPRTSRGPGHCFGVRAVGDLGTCGFLPK